jgi:glycosyltransferase involved in cell wall biosynthesis
MMPDITAVIPTYNRAELAARAIESVLAQSAPPLELVVVDDGSSDHTASVVERYGSRVRYVRQENAGLYAARNTGVRHSGGDWIAFLDDDDVWKPDFLARMGGAIDATAGAAFVYFTDLERAGESQTLWEAGGFAFNEPFEIRTDASDWFMRRFQPTAIQAIVIRRDAYWQVGGQANNVREDTHQFFLLGLAGPACAVAGVGAVLSADAPKGSRITEHTHSKTRRYCDDTIWLYADVLRRHPALPRYQRRILGQRLADAYLLRARLDFDDRQLPGSLRAFGRSLALSPRGIGVRISKGMIRRWGRVSSRPAAAG